MCLQKRRLQTARMDGTGEIFCPSKTRLLASAHLQHHPRPPIRVGFPHHLALHHLTACPAQQATCFTSHSVHRWCIALQPPHGGSICEDGGQRPLRHHGRPRPFNPSTIHSAGLQSRELRAQPSYESRNRRPDQLEEGECAA